MPSTYREFPNSFASKYLSFVLNDIGHKNFKIIFGDEEEKHLNLLEQWKAYVRNYNLKKLVNVATNNVLKHSNGALIVDSGSNGFKSLRPDKFTVERVSEDYDFEDKTDYIVKVEDKEIDLKESLWVYFANQDDEIAPMSNGFTHSYYDIWKDHCIDLEDLIKKRPAETLKSNTLIYAINGLSELEDKPIELAKAKAGAKRMYDAITIGHPVARDSELEISQLTYDGNFLSKTLTELFDELAILTSIPLSQLKGMVIGGFSTTGAAENDSKNYIKLITRIQDIVREIWLFFVKKFLYEIGDDLGTNIDAIKVVAPVVYRMPIKEQIAIIREIREEMEVDVNNSERYEALLYERIDKLVEGES